MQDQLTAFYKTAQTFYLRIGLTRLTFSKKRLLVPEKRKKQSFVINCLGWIHFDPILLPLWNILERLAIKQK
jgi:hypothetical protein